jgi:hypothetical protein
VVRGRWLRRGAGRQGEGPWLDVAELGTHHLLLVPSTVSPGEVAELVRARVPAGDLGRDGLVSLGRHSRLSGPYELSMEEAVDAGVPMPWTVAYALQAPIEREDPPLAGTDDRDGFTGAFPDGLPWREEGRGLHLLVALARRLQGAVRVADGREVLTPDPDRAVDHAVHSPYWLDPDVLLNLVAREIPTARLAVEGQEWAGPPPEAYTGELVLADLAHDPLDPDELADLHAAADDVDLDALQDDAGLDAYAVHAPLGRDGAVEVLVHVTDPGEPAAVGQPWADQPFATYEVRWVSPDPADRESPDPSDAHVLARARVRPLVTAVARSIVEAVGGVVADEDGFWVDRYAL